MQSGLRAWYADEVASLNVVANAVEKEDRSERLVRLDAEALPLGCIREQLTLEFLRHCVTSTARPSCRRRGKMKILHRRQLAVVLW